VRAPSRTWTSALPELFNVSAGFFSAFFILLLNIRRIRISIIADKAIPPIMLPTTLAILAILLLFKLGNTEVEFPGLFSIDEDKRVIFGVENRGIKVVLPVGNVVVVDTPVGSCTVMGPIRCCRRD
jgi:hypothetical protein